MLLMVVHILLRDTSYGDPPVQQAMHIVQENGVKIQKGLRRILNERNIVTDGMNKAAIADRLSQEPDFLSQKG
jgi:hypothetical protein